MSKSESKSRIWNRIFKRKDYTPLPTDSKIEDSRAFRTVSASVSQDQNYFIPPPPSKYSEVLNYPQKPNTNSQKTTEKYDPLIVPPVEQEEVFPAGVYSVELEQLRNSYKYYLKEYKTAQVSMLTYTFFIIYYLYYDPYIISKAVFFAVVVSFSTYIHCLKFTNWTKPFIEKQIR